MSTKASRSAARLMISPAVALLLLWMIVAATYLAERNKNAVPGFLLALGACFKLTPLIYVPYFFMRRCPSR